MKNNRKMLVVIPGVIIILLSGMFCMKGCYELYKPDPEKNPTVVNNTQNNQHAEVSLDDAVNSDFQSKMIDFIKGEYQVETVKIYSEIEKNQMNDVGKSMKDYGDGKIDINAHIFIGLDNVSKAKENTIIKTIKQYWKDNNLEGTCSIQIISKKQYQKIHQENYEQFL